MVPREKLDRVSVKAVKCKLCLKSFAKCRSTRSLNEHLRHIHSTVLKDELTDGASCDVKPMDEFVISKPSRFEAMCTAATADLVTELLLVGITQD